eukprot:1161408-Pelagomonas_calceolata.AAC.7
MKSFRAVSTRRFWQPWHCGEARSVCTEGRMERKSNRKAPQKEQPQPRSQSMKSVPSALGRRSMSLIGSAAFHQLSMRCCMTTIWGGRIPFFTGCQCNVAWAFHSSPVVSAMLHGALKGGWVCTGCQCSAAWCHQGWQCTTPWRAAVRAMPPDIFLGGCEQWALAGVLL